MGQKLFVHFLEEWKTPKYPFEINWPLIRNVLLLTGSNNQFQSYEFNFCDQLELGFLLIGYCFFRQEQYELRGCKFCENSRFVVSGCIWNQWIARFYFHARIICAQKIYNFSWISLKNNLYYRLIFIRVIWNFLSLANQIWFNSIPY